MISIHASLSKLLRVREIREQQRETMLARSLNERNQCQEAMERAHKSQLQTAQAFREHLQGTVDLFRAQELREQYAYRGHMVQQHSSSLKSAENEVAVDRKHMVEARRARRLVDNLHEQSQERLAWEWQQQDNARLDEIGVQYYLRERR